MKQEQPDPLRIEVTNKQGLTAAAVIGITCPYTAAQFAKDVANYAVLAQAHAEHVWCLTHDQPGGDAARRVEDAQLDAPAVLSIDHATTSAGHQQREQDAQRCARAEQMKQRDADLEAIRSGAIHV